MKLYLTCLGVGHKRKLKNLCDDMAKLITLEMMQQVCPNTGRKSNYKMLKHKFNVDIRTLIIDIYSQWIGKNNVLANESLHEVTSRVTIFGNDKKHLLR